jgi:hypothetical protein
MNTLHVTAVLKERWLGFAGRVKHKTEMRKFRKHQCARPAQLKFRYENRMSSEL